MHHNQTSYVPDYYCGVNYDNQRVPLTNVLTDEELNSNYTHPLPDKEPFCVWIGNLPPWANPSLIITYFKSLNIVPKEVRLGRIVKNRYSCAYVDLYTQQDMKSTLRTIDSTTATPFYGRKIEIDIHMKNTLSMRSKRSSGGYKPRKIVHKYDSHSVDTSRAANQQRMGLNQNTTKASEETKLVKKEMKQQDEDEGLQTIHMLVIYKNTSICLKFKDYCPNFTQKMDDNLYPIIINMNLQKFQKTLNDALVLIDVSIPNSLILLLSQYIFPQRECKCKDVDTRLTLFDNINNFGKLFGTYCCNGKFGHDLIKKYENVVLNIGDICNDYSQLTTFTLFDDYIYENMDSTKFDFHLCRSHYVMKKI